MDKIPFDEQRILDELGEFWQTGVEPGDLAAHIDQVSGIWAGGRDTRFFRQALEDLRADKHSKYAFSSVSEYKQHLEGKYRQAQKEEKIGFFQRRFEALRTDKHSKYAAFSPSELKQLVEDQYHQERARLEAERQERAKAKQREERERMAKWEAEWEKEKAAIHVKLVEP